MRITFILSVACVIGFVVPFPADAEPAATTTISADSAADIDGMSRAVTSALIAGDAKRAVDALVAGSPLMAGKTIEMDALRSQIQTALTAYGPIGSVDLAKQQQFGNSAVRRYYVAHHEKMVTRWELVFARTSQGWIMTYLGFDDQQRSWFDR